MQKDNPKTILFLLSAMGFLTSGDIYSSAPLLVSISADLKITVTSAALSVTSYMGAFALFNLVFGPLGDRYGRTKIIILCSFGTSIFSCLCFLADSLSALIFYRMFNGAFAAGIMPVSVAIIGEVFTENKRQKAITSMIGIMILGGASAAFIGGGLSYYFSWKSVYLLYGMAELGVAFWLLFRLDHLAPTKEKLSILKMYPQVLNNRLVLCCFLLVGTGGIIVAGAFSFTGELLRSTTDLNLLQIGAVLSLFGTGGIASSGLSGYVRRLSIFRVCAIAGVCGSVSIYCLSFTTATWGFAAAFFIWGLSFVSIHSAYINAVQSLIPDLKGTIMSLMSFCWLSGGTLGTLINKQVIELYQVGTVYVYTSVLFVVFAVIAASVLAIINRVAISPDNTKEREACILTD